MLAAGRNATMDAMMVEVTLKTYNFAGEIRVVCATILLQKQVRGPKPIAFTILEDILLKKCPKYSCICQADLVF